MAADGINVLESPDHLTADWLTGALQDSGVLRKGNVTELRRRANSAFNSAVVHLDLKYSPDVDSSVPRHLLLKVSRNGAGRGEVEFYQSVARLRQNLPMLVRCYQALHCHSTGTSNVLLQDLSATHGSPVERKRVLALDAVPPDAMLDQIADSLGRFHAYWWEHEVLGSYDFALVRPWYRDREHYDRHVQRRWREWAAFDGAVGHEIPANLRDLYAGVLEAMPYLWDRYLADRVLPLRHLTLSHGDCYLGQFLCPADSATDQTYLVDFGDVSANFGAYDLVYAFCTFWTPGQRRESEREKRLLERYHRALFTGGVVGYSRDQLLADYRLMILFMLFDPVWNQTDGSRREYWWPKMQCLSAAFRDLDCARLLRECRLA